MADTPIRLDHLPWRHLGREINTLPRLHVYFKNLVSYLLIRVRRSASEVCVWQDVYVASDGMDVSSTGACRSIAGTGGKAAGERAPPLRLRRPLVVEAV